MKSAPALISRIRGRLGARILEFVDGGRLARAKPASQARVSSGSPRSIPWLARPDRAGLLTAADVPEFQQPVQRSGDGPPRFQAEVYAP